jgi:tetratricopeptide (TPR) repeat protein
VTGTSQDGKHMKVAGRTPTRTYRSALETDVKAKGEQLVLAFDPARAPSFDGRNDYAMGLIYLGRITEAIEVLQKLEQENPGSYFVAANLGTAYELTGRNREALRWIHEAIRRNDDSHFGSEWVHVKILDAKVQQEINPSYFDKHSVLNIDLTKVRSHETMVDIGGENRTLAEIRDAIDYQLQERLHFVRGKDAGVASLLFDRALIEATLHTLESAGEILNLAADFGYPRSRIDRLTAQYARTIADAKVRQVIFWAGVVIAAVALLVFAHRRSSSPRGQT